ncbi:MAG: 3-methyl-2-oxobutanoate hydroxymethyltransferase [Verrucomicrobia bacterium]|nr:3-methyl-2-oxobutanoate hydroxymethyltransferase [Verrucomicrobiota bacterium]MCF7709464.1 3-methyl-2-oxobutanoate hydroxymethyltransferase [Verrucomicrobiota bacterium]
MDREKITPDKIIAMKARGERVPSLTAYDYPITRMLDEAGVPLILVGDSLGMVVLGYPDTTYVTMEDMEHHVRACSRAKPKALLVADMPYGSYANTSSALENARRLMDAGAEAVKAEGGRDIIPQVRAIIEEGIPFLGHLGMLPQHVREEGGYKIKGRVETEVNALLADAKALEQAGAFGIVLELVLAEPAQKITAAVRVPTIGIGSGRGCDGQILVTYDLLGMFPWFKPPFVKQMLRTAELSKEAVAGWMNSVRSGE